MIDAIAQEPGRTRTQASLKWSSWYLTALKLAMGLLLLLLIALLWLLRENAANEQRSTLIADVLWIEQSISFRLEGMAEQFEQLAIDLTDERSNPAALFTLRSRHLLKNNPELRQLIWLDASGARIDAMPTQSLGGLGDAPGRSEKYANSQARSLELASKLGKRVYTDAYRTSATAPFETDFELYLPLFEKRVYRGSLVAVYSLKALLHELVPWWFAEKYQVRIIDANGVALASKSKVSSTMATLSYSIPFDPPGFGMALQVTSYGASGSIVPTLISSSIVALVALVLWSLWMMRGHIRRRLTAEQALRSEHAFRQAMENSLTVGMRARDLEGHVTYANPAFCQMVGFSVDELINARPPMPYWAPEVIEETQARRDAVLQGKAPREGFEIRFMRKDGRRFDALIYEAPLIDADGKHQGWMASIVDVTARKHAEELAREQQEKLQRTSRLVTMGELASTLAHELSQPLAAITSYNAGCLNKLESGAYTDGELSEALTKLGVQAQRAGRIVRRVHDFVRKSEPKFAACDLAEVIEDSAGFIEAAAKLLNVRIVREIPVRRAELIADRMMLEQVLLNLMRNGLEAMSGAAPDRRCLTVKLKRLDDRFEIRVVDRGPGIPPEVQEKLFTPFFSTKPEGMGMGLNICRTIIELHHGRLSVDGNPEGGTISLITLPIAQS